MNILVNFTVFVLVYASNFSHFIISVYLTDILNYIFLTRGIGEVTRSIMRNKKIKLAATINL